MFIWSALKWNSKTNLVKHWFLSLALPFKIKAVIVGRGQNMELKHYPDVVKWKRVFTDRAGLNAEKTRTVVKHRLSDAWTRQSGNDHLTNPPGCGKASFGSGSSHSVSFFSASGKYQRPQPLTVNSSFPWKQRWRAKYSQWGNVGLCYSLCALNCASPWCCQCSMSHFAPTHSA